MLSTLFSQIQITAPYKLLWRKLTLSQPKPVHCAKEYNNKEYWKVRDRFGRWELLMKCQRPCHSWLHLHSLQVLLAVWVKIKMNFKGETTVFPLISFFLIDTLIPGKDLLFCLLMHFSIILPWSIFQLAYLDCLLTTPNVLSKV